MKRKEKNFGCKPLAKWITILVATLFIIVVYSLSVSANPIVNLGSSEGGGISVNLVKYLAPVDYSSVNVNRSDYWDEHDLPLPEWTKNHDQELNTTSNVIFNTITSTENSTFEKDVIINGILYGGSPVKIDGIDVTNNLYTQTDNVNSSLRFTLQNTNGESNATTIMSAINDNGGSMSLGIASSGYMMGTTIANSIVALFSRSQGATYFANFYNQAFIWMLNPQDDNNVENLEEIMRLNLTGSDIIGNITADNLFQSQHLFSHTNATMTMAGANIWTNITFSQEEAKIKEGIEHTHNSSSNYTFNITQPGVYDVSFNFDIIDTSASASDIDIAGRMIHLNGTEIHGSVFETDIIKQQVETELSHEFLAELQAGDQVIMQFTATDADVQISTHGTYGDHPESATMSIIKIANK